MVEPLAGVSLVALKLTVRKVKSRSLHASPMVQRRLQPRAASGLIEWGKTDDQICEPLGSLDFFVFNWGEGKRGGGKDVKISWWMLKI